MKYRIHVTKKDIREHWNGHRFSCPIHEAVARVTGNKHNEVSSQNITICTKKISLTRKARIFSTLQSAYCNLGDRSEFKKQALRKLKPLSFVLDVP